MAGAAAKRKHNGETIIMGSGGIPVQAVVTWTVQDALTASEALGATDLPVHDTEHELGGIFVSATSVRAIDKGVSQWEVDVTYTPPGGSISFDQVTVAITTGTEIQRVDAGINGTGVGTDGIWDRDQDPQVFVDDKDHGELYADLFIPTLEFEVTMPRTTQPDVALWFSLLTHVNLSPISLGNLEFPKHCVQYTGTASVPLDTTGAQHEIIHRFRAGATELPVGLPRQEWYGSPALLRPWLLGYAPLGFAWWTVPAKRTIDGQVYRYPTQVVLTQMYKASNLSVLWTA